MPTFASVKLAIRHGTQLLRRNMARKIMESELQHKHIEKRKIRKKILETMLKLRNNISSIIYRTVLHQINKATKGRTKSILARHDKKLKILRQRQHHNEESDYCKNYFKYTVCNMSSYQLSHDEYKALSFGLDHHIPSKTDSNLIYTGFECYYQNIVHKIENLSDDQKCQLKTKLRSACEKYNRVKVSFKYREIINKLSNNSNIILLRQDKGRGIVVIDRKKYTEKCMDMLNTKQFRKLDKHPTKTIEAKIERAARKIKNHLSTSECRALYPSGSAPGKFYGTAKKHKIPVNGTVDDLPLRPVISNTGTASHHPAKYLAKTLSPLSKSEYTVNNNLEFINYMKTISIPSDHKPISFDVKSLFTNVPLDFTIDLILKRIYKDNEIQTNIKKKEMKQLPLLCTKNVHFSYNGIIYQQCDGVAMGSPLGPVLAGIFMVHLERTLIPKLTEPMNPWKRYVEDTISIIKETSISRVLTVLNSFHKNIEFTYEMEENGKIAVLDVLIIRNNNPLKTTVYRKKTHSGFYLHWKSSAPPT